MGKRIGWLLTLLVCATFAMAADDDGLDQAIAAAKERLQAEPQAAKVYLELAVLYTLKLDADAAAPMFANGITLADTATVVDAYERVNQKSRENPEDKTLGRLVEGLDGAARSKLKCEEAEAIRLKSWKSALKLCDEAIQLCPVNAAAYVQRSSAHLRSNRELKGKGRTSAIDDCTKAIELCPVYADAYLERALVRDDAGLLNVLMSDNDKVARAVSDEVMADIEKAIKIQPTHARAFNIRAQMLTRKHEKALEDRSDEHPYDGKFAELALADFSKVVELEPKSAKAYIDRAEFELDRYDVSEGVADLDKALEIDSENSRALKLRVEYFERDLEWYKLIRGLSILIRESATIDRLDLRGETCLRVGWLDKAMADFDASVELAKRKEKEAENRTFDDPEFHKLMAEAARERGPRSVRADVGRGRVLAAKGQRDEALAAFDEALKINPRSVEAYLARGELYQATGKGDKAQADFAKAIALSTTFSNKKPKARMAGLEALYHISQKDISNALKSANDATFHDPTYATGFMIQAQLLMSKQDADGALKALDQLVKVTPGDADAFLARAQIYFAKNDVGQAIDNYSAASKLRPEDYRIWATLGELHFKFEEPDNANYCFEKVEELKPRHAPTQLHLAIFYAAMGVKNKESREALEAGLAMAKPQEIQAALGIAQAELKRNEKSDQLKEVVEKLKNAATEKKPSAEPPAGEGQDAG